MAAAVFSAWISAMMGAVTWLTTPSSRATTAEMPSSVPREL